MGVTRRKR